jgi:hypothetical protein
MSLPLLAAPDVVPIRRGLRSIESRSPMFPGTTRGSYHKRQPELPQVENLGVNFLWIISLVGIGWCGVRAESEGDV